MRSNTRESIRRSAGAEEQASLRKGQILRDPDLFSPPCLASFLRGYTPNRAGKRVSSKGGEVRCHRDFESRGLGQIVETPSFCPFWCDTKVLVALVYARAYTFFEQKGSVCGFVYEVETGV